MRNLVLACLAREETSEMTMVRSGIVRSARGEDKKGPAGQEMCGEKFVRTIASRRITGWSALSSSGRVVETLVSVGLHCFTRQEYNAAFEELPRWLRLRWF